MKIHPLGVDFFRADWRKDRPIGMKNLTVSFRNFANAHKMRLFL